VRSLAGRRVLVVGLGVSGFAAARALLELEAKVRVTEDASGAGISERAEVLRGLGAEVEIGGHQEELLDADLAVVSPGIPPEAAVAVALRNAGIEIIGEVELAYRLASCDFLAVTGTNGKTTTTSLLADMLVEGGIDSVAAGNIGLPLIEAVGKIPRGGAIAVEVSSFQLETIRDFHPRVAVILNIAEDHTDWHGTMKDYAAAKARIVENQDGEDVVVFNAEDAAAARIASMAEARAVPFSAVRVPPGGVGVAGKHLARGSERLLDVAEISLSGAAGLEDVAAAAAAALEYGVDDRAVARAIREFRPLKHRLEVVAEVDGVTYVDDSKATNPHATMMAVRGLSDVVLIAGGRSKGVDLAPMATTVPPVRAVVAMGEAADEVARVFEGRVPVMLAQDMRDAVAKARSQSVESGSVLLSPGCASLDMYESYAARGDAFVRAVREMVGHRESEEQPSGNP
jgi:UDP-N-acetylmuramoylalanine--D-glutamate ligase